MPRRRVDRLTVDGVSRMQTLIDDLLSYSRVRDTGQSVRAWRLQYDFGAGTREP